MGDFSVVGIGSSAGGLEAMSKLLRAVPEQSGLAFVVAAHLDPTHESHLVALLARCTAMPVVQIENGTRVEPDHVYVIAPDRELTIKEGVLRSTRPEAPRGHRHPVDVFFRSLAEDQGERAIGVILSGTGTNGSLGLRFIKAEGGIVVAQEPETAGFQGMPRSAMGTGVVDLVLPPERIPEALLGVTRFPGTEEKLQEPDGADPHDQLRTLLALLRAQARRDFDGYKKRTLLRRIHRRMGLHRIASLGDYIDRLRKDPHEVKALVADLTINVTGFFRDPEAWQELASKVVGPLVQERPTDSAIRVWVPGCSTGEEAYSVAMLLAEAAETAGKSFDLRLFATDVAESVLSPARAGHYPGSVALDVGEERLARFFEQQDDTYYIRKSLREMITFAPQNLLQDPPFSRLDLISCRNLLIYLEPECQRRVLGLFHFALREGGHLFLGSAETTSGQEDLFQTVSKKWRIFRRLGPTRHDIVDFPIFGDGQQTGGAALEPAARNAVTRRAGNTMEQALLDRYAPASALIDASFRVHYLRGPTEDYLRPPSGEPSFNLLAMAREGLQVPLRAMTRQALDEGREIATSARVRRSGTYFPVRLVATPVKQDSEPPDRLLIGFFERDAAGDTTMTPPPDTPSGEMQLQTELETAREDLRLTIEQMEAANEELKASNEEIRSINEELQASNEELETSKEELQSLNEELNTVNNQLQAKVGELEERTADLNNLLNSTDVATLFLDRALSIRWFTPAMKALFELLPTDVGRPIAHFAQRFSGGDLLDDANAVLARLSPIDNEVVSDQGRWYVRHIAPYRTDDDRIAGVVVSFSDITERKRWERQIDAARDFAESIVDTLREPLLVLTSDLRVQTANKSYYDHFSATPQETEGRSIFALGEGHWNIPELRELLENVLPENNKFNDFEIERDFGSIGFRTLLLNARRLDDVQLILVAFEDITERKRAADAQRASEERLRKVLETDAVGVLFFDAASGRLTDANGVFLHMTGYSREDVASGALSWRSLTPEEWVPTSEKQMVQLAETGRIGPYEKEYLMKDGSRSWMLFAGASLDDGTVVEFAIDIQDRKRAEQERELLANELSHRIKNTLAVVQALAMQTDGQHSIEEYRSVFLGRLRSLAQAHSLLLGSHWRSADLENLIEQSVAPYATDRPGGISLEGAPIELSPRQSLGLALVLHELATNAAKYGSLSDRNGRLRVSWRRINSDGTAAVELLWQESDGPVAEKPGNKGFGSKLIEQACSYELNGKAELDYAPEGLTCRISFPLS